jgi:Mrp family chromosome partitioning ATPase
MTDLAESLSGLARALSPPTGETGRCVLIMSARRGEGVSTISRTLAELAAQRARRAALLIDLDLLRNSQYRAYVLASRAGGAGLGAGVSGALGQQVFFNPKQAASAFSFHRVGLSRLLVGHFQSSMLPRGTHVSIRPDPAYWRSTRRAADCVVIDAPALERSRIGLVIARFMDAVVIVTSAERGVASETQKLQAELAAVNAPVVGLVFADADPTERAIDRALSQSSL